MRLSALTVLGVATAGAVALSAPAKADGHDADERVASMEQRIKHLEERVASQDQMMVEKEGEMAGLSDGWFNSVEIGGAIEVELVSESPAEGDSTVSAGVGTAELGIAATINDEWSGEMVVEHDGDAGSIVLGDAFLTYEPEGSGLTATLGGQTLPFGVYETNLISDPLTLELGETGGTSVVLSGEAASIGWTLLTYHDGGETIDGFGFGLGTAMEGDDSSFGVDLSWISDIGDSDGLSEQFEDDVPGMSAAAHGSVGPVSAIVEFVTAINSDSGGAEPSAWQAEAAYSFDLMGKEAVAAVGASGTNDGAGAGLAESLMLVGFSVGVSDGIGLGIEYSQRQEYEANGTDDAITVLLAAEF